MRYVPLAVAMLIVAVSVPCSLAATTHDAAWWQARAEEIIVRQWAALDAPPEWAPERPPVIIKDEPTLNAYAKRLGDSMEVPFKTEIVVYMGLIDKTVCDDVDALAGIIGHELGHISLGHHTKDWNDATYKLTQSDNAIGVTATREMEHACDLFGAKISAKAGYDPNGIVRNFMRGRTELGETFFWEALAYDHPSATERLAVLDQNREQMWQAVVDFEVGVEMLKMGDYPCAQQSFEGALAYFPDAPEVLGNLGYAKIMQYYHGLPQWYWDTHKDVGQPMPMGFSTFLPVDSDPTSRDEQQISAELRKLWAEATEHLSKAVELKGDYVLGIGNMAFASLIAPDGPDAQAAAGYLARAKELVGENELLALAIANNQAINANLQGSPQQARALLQEAEAAFPEGKRGVNVPQINLCVLLADSQDPGEQQTAAEGLEKLCKGLPPGSAQWQYVYLRYQGLCQATGRTALPEDQLKTKSLQKMSMHFVRGQQKIYLGDTLSRMARYLGSPDAVIPVGPKAQVPRTADEQAPIYCWRYLAAGLELTFFRGRLVRAKFYTTPSEQSCNAVLAIEGKKVGQLTIGDSVDSVESLLPPFEEALMLGEEKPFRYYPAVGFAVQIENKQVKSIALARGSTSAF